MSKTVLELININKKFSDSFSLKNVSLSLAEGEVHVILGENGSGKSVLMNIILGICQRDSGSILLNGKVVTINSTVDSKNLGISMIHQDSYLFDHLSVSENIFMDSKPYYLKYLKLINTHNLNAKCQELFNNLGLTINPKTLVKNLNIAQKQIVEICKAYVSNSKIIIMDEPSSSLTKSETQILFNIIRELKKNKVSILYISHKLDEIRQIGDKITILREGEVVTSEPLNENNISSIIHKMTNKDIKQRFPKLRVPLGNEILTVKNLSSGKILKNISFSVKKGEIVGIIGLVGSGRTKIAKCIFGIDKYEGNINFFNKELIISSPIDAIREGIGYLSEDRTSDGLFPCRSVIENITAASMYKVSNKSLIDKSIEKNLASYYVDKLGIKINSLDEKVAFLSGGNQQKVLLSKWIMTKSKLLILDEPTKGIDIPSKVDFYNLMNEMILNNVSIILISSDVDEILGMCDRILVLCEGRIVANLSRHEATHEKIMFYATGQMVNC